MSVSGGPKVDDDGLVACFDAASKKSIAGEPTVNLFTNPTLVGDTELGGAWGSYGCTYTIVEDGCVTPLSQRMVGPAAPPEATWRNSGIRFSLNGLTVSTTYTFTFYGKDLDNTYGIGYYYVGWLQTSSTSTTLDNGWKKYVLVLSATSTNTIIYIRPDNNNKNIAVDGLINAPQFEQKDHSTPFVDGARDTFFDISRNGNNADAPIRLGYDYSNKGSLVFDGSTNMNIVPSSSLNNTQFTVIAWIKHTELVQSGSGERYILYYNGANGGSRYGCLVGFSSNTLSNNGALNLVIGNGGWNGYSSNKNSWISDRWYHIAVTCNGSSYFMYVDGVLDKSGASVAPIFTTMNNPTNGIGINMVGNISTVKVYNRALSENKITRNFEATKGRFGL